MDFETIEKALKLMKEHKLTEITYEDKENFKLTLKQGGEAPVAIAAPAAAAPVAAAAPAAAPEAAGLVIESPIVGTFYAAPSPESPNFVNVGDTVSEDTTICIVEAMKVMNDIKAEVKGEITEILVENGSPVEFGQPLFRYKPL